MTVIRRRLATGVRMALLSAGALLPAQVRAQNPPARTLVPGDTVLATPNGRYNAGWLHRLLLGSHHRDLWATPVRAPVLDLATFAGGLTPIARGGGQQTRSLRLAGADGLIYNFRSIDKDASRTLDPELRRSIAADVLQDQISALLPMSALVVDPLLDAADVLHPHPQLVIMPSDPRLGEFRGDFAGMLGFIEERPNEGEDDTPGFGGSEKVVGSERLLERLEEDPTQRLDARLFLRARLIDMLVGDWDRHPDQWRWASYERDGRLVWEPVPRDRDWALARLDGLLVWAAGFAWPHYVGFDEGYPSAFKLSWAGRALDRQLLTGLSRAEWEAETNDLVARLSDDVIGGAVRALPPAYHERIGAKLERALLARRNDLPAQSAEFYDLLAGYVDVHTTDADEQVVVERIEDGRVRVTVDAPPPRRAAISAPIRVFDRTFMPDETKEVRLFLQGGEDHLTVQGPSGGPILVRVIGGGGDDTLIDETSGKRVNFYDARGDNRYTLAGGTHLDEREWVQPPDPSSETHRAKARDWGTYWVPVPNVGFDPDLGLFVGAGAIRWGYGFRHFPYKSKLTISGGIGTSTLRPSATLTYDFPVTRPGLRGLLDASFTGAELNRFYGLGNGTPADSEAVYFEARRQSLRVSTMIGTHLGSSATIAFGPMFRHVRPYGNEGTLLDAVDPYGNGDFSEAALLGRLTLGTRGRPGKASAGASFDLDGGWYPAILDVESSFGRAGASAAAWVAAPLPLDPVLRLHGGAAKLWGDYPYFDAAYIGGDGSVRGYNRQRFGGDASVFGGAELRIALTDFYIFLPGTFGLLGLADAGRVFLDDEEADDWHSAVGGGIWIAALSRANSISVSIARSEERTGVYVKAGFSF